MYKIISKFEAKNYPLYKLCYIDEIEKEYYDYTPEAKAYRQTEEWKEQDKLRTEKFHKQGFLSSNDTEFSIFYNPILKKGSEMQAYPNPDYIEGKQEFYAYFTPLDLSEQTGDDWNDTPYEYNAGEPYDSQYKEKDINGHWIEYTIIKIPFYVDHDEWDTKFPKDYGTYGNSPFCVDDINAGVVPWIYNKSNRLTIHAGVSPEEFLNKINILQECKMNA